MLKRVRPEYLYLLKYLGLTPFLSELAKAMTDHFRKSEFTPGLVLGVKRTGELLAEHFPCRRNDKNELSDDIARD